MTNCDINQMLASILEKLAKEGLLERSKIGLIKIGVSNRHVHLDREAMDVLFGIGSELTYKKALGQPGQYAAQETVTLRGPKGIIERVRVLGPLRSQSQVEISVGDGFLLGVSAPIRESGRLEGTPGVGLVGPEGSVQLKQGVIVAARHIHMTPADAILHGVRDKNMVSVRIDGVRGAVLNNVLVRVAENSALEMHIDVEEANGIGAINGTSVTIIMPSSNLIPNEETP